MFLSLFALREANKVFFTEQRQRSYFRLKSHVDLGHLDNDFNQLLVLQSLIGKECNLSVLAGCIFSVLVVNRHNSQNCKLSIEKFVNRCFWLHLFLALQSRLVCSFSLRVARWRFNLAFNSVCMCHHKRSFFKAFIRVCREITKINDSLIISKSMGKQLSSHFSVQNLKIFNLTVLSWFTYLAG